MFLLIVPTFAGLASGTPYPSKRQETIDRLDLPFQLFFTLELILRIAANGLIMGKGA
jgi:hypothetical protein